MAADQLDIDALAAQIQGHRGMIHKVVDPNGNPIDIPMGPDDPRWLERTKVLDGDRSALLIKDPPPASIPQAVAPTPAPAVGSTKRVVISYGPKEGQFIVAVEVAPDWDTEDDPVMLEKTEVVAVAKVVKLLGIRLKNLTGAGFA